MNTNRMLMRVGMKSLLSSTTTETMDQPVTVRAYPFKIVGFVVGSVLVFVMDVQYLWMDGISTVGAYLRNVLHDAPVSFRVSSGSLAVALPRAIFSNGAKDKGYLKHFPALAKNGAFLVRHLPLRPTDYAAKAISRLRDFTFSSFYFLTASSAIFMDSNSMRAKWTVLPTV